MKKILFYLTTFLFCSAAFGQQGIINVSISDFCGSLSDKDYKIILQKTNGDNEKITIAEAAGAETQFGEIEAFGSYTIKIEPQFTVEIPKLIINAGLMRNFIVGNLRPDLFMAFNLAGDINQSLGLTTLDLVLLTRYYIGLNNETPRHQIIVRSDDITNNQFPQEINTFDVKVDKDGNFDLHLISISPGDMLSNLIDYCENCDKSDQLHDVNIIVDDQILIEGQNYNIPLSIGSTDKNLYQIIFKLNTDGLNINNLTSESIPNFNIEEGNSSIKTYVQVDQSNGSNINLLLNVTALKNGLLSNMLGLDTGFFHQASYNGDNCLLWTSGLKFEVTNKIESECMANWPENTTLKYCTTNPFTGLPKIKRECDQNILISYRDIDFNCTEFEREWRSENQITGIIELHTQKVRFKENYDFLCKEDFIVLIESAENITTLKPADLLYRFDENSLLSFSKDPSDTIVNIDAANIPTFLEVHDLTKNEVCYTGIQLNCLFNPEDFIQDTVYLTYRNNLYIRASDLYSGPTNICNATVEVKIATEGGIFKTEIPVKESDLNNYIPVRLRYSFGAQLKTYGTIWVYISQNVEYGEPVKICIEDIGIEKDKEYSIPVRVTSFNDIEGFQFGLNLKNGSFMGIDDIHPSLSGLNYNESENNIYFLWVHPTSSSISINDGEILFRIKFESTDKDSLRNILQITEGFDAIAQSHSGGTSLFLLCFEELPNATVELADRSNQRLKVWPNPASDIHINLRLDDDSDIKNKIVVKLMNITGQMIKYWQTDELKINNQKIINLTLPEDLDAGLYFIEVSSGLNKAIDKIVVLK